QSDAIPSRAGGAATSGWSVRRGEVAVCLLLAELDEQLRRVRVDAGRLPSSMPAGLAHGSVDGREALRVRHVDLRAALDEELHDVGPTPARGTQQSGVCVRE